MMDNDFVDLFPPISNYSLFKIESIKKETIIEITHDGDILVNINGEMIKIEDKKEIGYAFALSIAKINGIITYTEEREEEIVNKIVSHFRNRQLNKIV